MVGGSVARRGAVAAWLDGTSACGSLARRHVAGWREAAPGSTFCIAARPNAGAGPRFTCAGRGCSGGALQAWQPGAAAALRAGGGHQPPTHRAAAAADVRRDGGVLLLLSAQPCQPALPVACECELSLHIVCLMHACACDSFLLIQAPTVCELQQERKQCTHEHFNHAGRLALVSLCLRSFKRSLLWWPGLLCCFAGSGIPSSRISPSGCIKGVEGW